MARERGGRRAAGTLFRRAPDREKLNPPAEELYSKKWAIFGVMMIGWAMALLDVSIVNIAIPELQRDLDANTDTVTWVINAYNIAFAVTLVTMGRLADQFGRKRFFIAGMALFTLGSALCAAAWSIDALIFFRVIQGIGAGTLAPLGFAMTVLVFPPAERGKGLAIIAIVALVSSALGPVLGGVILEITTWHWIFLINVPFGVLGIVLARRIWPETYDLSAIKRQPDWLGMALLTLAVFSLTFALAEANARGWDDALILFLLQGSVLLAGAFYLSQRYGRWPMITPGLMKNKQFTGANTTMVLFAAGAFGALFLLSLVFQNLWGYDQWEAALALLPVPITGMLVWPLIGKGADTRPPRQMAVPALLIMAVGPGVVLVRALDLGVLARLPDRAAGPHDDRDRPGDRVPVHQRRRDGCGVRPGARTGVGHREHRPPARGRDRDRASGGHDHHRLRLHARVRQGGHHRRQRSGGAAAGDGAWPWSEGICRLHRRLARPTGGTPGPASTR